MVAARDRRTNQSKTATDEHSRQSSRHGLSGIGPRAAGRRRPGARPKQRFQAPVRVPADLSVLKFTHLAKREGPRSTLQSLRARRCHQMRAIRCPAQLMGFAGPRNDVCWRRGRPRSFQDRRVGQTHRGAGRGAGTRFLTRNGRGLRNPMQQAILDNGSCLAAVELTIRNDTWPTIVISWLASPRQNVSVTHFESFEALSLQY